MQKFQDLDPLANRRGFRSTQLVSCLLVGAAVIGILTNSGFSSVGKKSHDTLLSEMGLDQAMIEVRRADRLRAETRLLIALELAHNQAVQTESLAVPEIEEKTARMTPLFPHSQPPIDSITQQAEANAQLRHIRDLARDADLLLAESENDLNRRAGDPREKNEGYVAAQRGVTALLRNADQSIHQAENAAITAAFSRSSGHPLSSFASNR